MLEIKIIDKQRHDVQQVQSYFSISGKALVRNQAKLSELSEQWSGLEAIQKLKQLDKLARISDKLLQAPRQLLIVSEAEQAETIEKLKDSKNSNLHQ